MKISHKKIALSKKAVVVTSLVIILAIAGVIAYVKANNFWQPDKQTTTQDQKEQSTDTTAQSTQKDSSDTRHADSVKTPIQNQPTSKHSANTLQASITAANQNSNTLQIRTLIEAVTTQGACDLTLDKEDLRLTRTSGLQALADSTTCKGFDIPTSELEPGIWNLVIDITTSGKTTHLTKSITIK